MKFLFAGHTTFGNRGCEALIRSTVGLIRSRLPDARFVVPSSNIALDSRQWPQAAASGVAFVEAPPFPATVKWWNRAARVLPALGERFVPRHTLPDPLRTAMASCDAVIMSGGDVISLDYGLASLYFWTGWVDNAVALGKPAVLWAGSVGPFSKQPAVERAIVDHLRLYRGISVRESATEAYLSKLGQPPQRVADPAFTLQPEAFDHAALLPAAPQGCLGLNVSPLIRGWRPDEASRAELDAQIVQFIRDVLRDTGLGVVLIPHVGPLGGGSDNSDHHYMQGLLQGAGLDAARVRLAPATLNAAQLKHLVAQCRFFIGARTHATIAAFSSAVPTTSIAYSVKAKGINQDLFGHLDHVLETPAVSAATLGQHLARLQQGEGGIREFLAAAMPRVREQSALAVDHALSVLAAPAPR
jgi:polysaccharide pyruvyl transferase WcaK-like protein